MGFSVDETTKPKASRAQCMTGVIVLPPNVPHKHLYGDTRFSGGRLQNIGLIGLSPLGREKRSVIVTQGLGHSNGLCVMAGMAR